MLKKYNVNIVTEISKMLKETNDTELIHLIYCLLF